LCAETGFGVAPFRKAPVSTVPPPPSRAAYGSTKELARTPSRRRLTQRRPLNWHCRKRLSRHSRLTSPPPLLQGMGADTTDDPSVVTARRQSREEARRGSNAGMDSGESLRRCLSVNGEEAVISDARAATGGDEDWYGSAGVFRWARRRTEARVRGIPPSWASRRKWKQPVEVAAAVLFPILLADDV
jgi:hypothetical protein